MDSRLKGGKVSLIIGFDALNQIRDCVLDITNQVRIRCKSLNIVQVTEVM
jgi:hypothetical protein